MFRAFSPILGHDIRVIIKNVFSHFFPIFSPTYFSRTIRVFLEKLFGAFFPPRFGHDIRENIKNVFSLYFATIFSPTFFVGTIGLFLE